MSAEYAYVRNDYDKPGNRRMIQDRVVVIVAISAIVSSVLGLSMSCLMFLKAETLQNKNDPIACLPCLKLTKSSSNISSTDSRLAQLTRINDDGNMMCCAYNSEQLSRLLELVMEKEEPNPATLPEFNPRNFTFSPVSAHKMLHPPIMNKNSTDSQEDNRVFAQFKVKNNPLVEHIRNVGVHESDLQITYTGLYFVYSSIHFKPDSGRPCKDFKYQTWGHYVEKIVINYPSRSGLLLRTDHTCCDQCTNDSETSFTSGVFYLIEGDIIRVSVSGPGLVQFNKESSFAGLMMLGSDGEDNRVVSEHSTVLP